MLVSRKCVENMRSKGTLKDIIYQNILGAPKEKDYFTKNVGLYKGSGAAG